MAAHVLHHYIKSTKGSEIQAAVKIPNATKSCNGITDNTHFSDKLQDATVRTGRETSWLYLMPKSKENEYEVTICIKKEKSTTCQLNSLPTHLAKAYLPYLSSLATKMVNSSLVSGLVPP